MFSYYRYAHRTNKFLQDIAIVKLNSPYLFGENISAICKPRIRSFAADAVVDGQDGVVAGFNENSLELQSLNLTSMSFQTCERIYSVSLAPDKFCPNITNNESLCKGDSGTGYAELYQSKYYMLGILSHTPSLVQGCARNGYVVMTNARYIEADLKETFKTWLAEDKALY